MIGSLFSIAMRSKPTFLMQQTSKLLTPYARSVPIRVRPIIYKRSIHCTPKRNAPPLLAALLKTGGVKLMKGLSIVFGRSFRKFYDRLPDSVRSRIGKHKVLIFVTGFSLPFISYYSYTHYETCPITGRKKWVTFTKEQVVALADLDYEQLLKEYQGKLLHASDPLYQKNIEIVTSLIKANSDIDSVRNTEWTLHVIDDPVVTNAFVLPNGHIFVFTGMLKMLNCWEEMAVILGHEMSHAILGHSQEQQSYLTFGELLAVPLLAFIWFFFEDFAAFLIYTIQSYMYPLVFEYGFNLPYSRLLETEADEIGLMISSKACYDPRWSVLLWEKMAFQQTISEEADSDQFEYLSTHPGNQKRSAKLENLLPEMMAIRKQCNCPALPANVDPQAAAHQMRRCVANIKERKELMLQLKEKESLLDNNSFIESVEHKKKGIDDEILKIAKLESDVIKQRLEELEHEYLMLTSSHKEEKIEAKITSRKENNAFATLWGKITGKIAVSTQLSDTLFDEEKSKLRTVSLRKS